MPDLPRPASRRRWLRTSVRSLIVLVLLVGCWLGWMVRRARSQREAVAVIERSGGDVYYDTVWKNGKWREGPRPPKWLVDRVGIDYLSDVTLVNLITTGSEVDSVLGHVARLDRLQDLTIQSRYTTNTGLAHIRGLRSVRRLCLSESQVTDAGLVHLKGLTNLQGLYLYDTPITDAGLVHLRGLTNLNEVYLCDAPITDAGLVHLRGLTNLNEVYLYGTQVTDAGVQALQEALPKLTITVESSTPQPRR